ncbi:hypothetical protein E4U41_000630 [Claviceps citrina]|nr:hypothetical protein E4U41_000630 [Claviceps citrina]
MSPASAAPEGGRKVQPWTDEAKFQLLLRIVAQLREGGRPIDWQKINIPGRTTKSLQNTWSLINKSIAAFEEADKANGSGQDGGGRASPAKNATPRRKTPSKNKALAFHEAQDEDDEDPPKLVMPLKRKAEESPTRGNAKKLGRGTKRDPDDVDHDDKIKLELLEHVGGYVTDE